MKMLLAGDCQVNNVFSIVDPTTFEESEFEAEVVRALTCFYPKYWCGVFSGAFVLEGERRKSDLALVSKSLSHWYVIEVELAGHSLERHVLPQARCFRYGDPDDSCAASLMNAFSNLDIDAARHILQYVPRYVAIVCNILDLTWKSSIEGLDAQYLVVSVYKNDIGDTVHAVDGALSPRSESLGFAKYSAIDRCLHINNRCGLPVGSVQIVDQFGVPGIWTIRGDKGKLWISKDSGPDLLEHECLVQIIRTYDGRILLRPSSLR